MLITSITLQNYRNYQQQRCEFCPGINLFLGDNAQGKTNLIEAIYYLSIGKAYRPVKDEQLILWGKQNFLIRGTLESRQGSTTAEIQYSIGEKKSKTFKLGGLALKKAEELSGSLTSVLFSPDNMSIIKGSPQERRHFLDYDISQISRSYAKNLAVYQRLLAQRNNLLKRLREKRVMSPEKNSELELWDFQLAEVGGKIIEKRLQTLAKMNPLTRLMQRKLTGGQENIEIHYLFNRKTEIQGPTDLKAMLHAARDEALEEDLRFGTTQWGPHRDDLLITLNGIHLKQYGSQGQQRTAVLSLKLAELEFFRGESGEYPILLLDDVLSELDESRRQQLLELIQDKAIQCFITATEKSGLDKMDKRQIKYFEVRQGRIIPQDMQG